MNAAQYARGAACGGCIRACMNDDAPWHPGGRKCFRAIVDNQCPECKYGDIDIGENATAGGR